MSDSPSESPAEFTRSAPPRHVGRNALLGLLVALALAAWGIASRVNALAALDRQTSEATIQTVATVRPSRADAGEDLVLPGSVQAQFEAPIYARTSGYLKRWETDIGTPVKKGQLLAEIDTPEIDQQLVQAQADLATARANYALAESTDRRWQALLATDSVSKQDADDKAGDAATKKSLVDSARANLARLRDLESFKRVVAPFDGVVTARNTDIGALINAGQGAGAELFRVSDTRRLRVYVQVPQPYAAVATPGLGAELRFAEHPGKHYPAQIARTANALDPNARTLLVELQVDNAGAELFPGAYAEVHFKLPGHAESLRLPSNTLLFRTAGLQVATVGADHRITLKRVTQGRDFGSSIELLDGVGPDDEVVINPPDSLVDGEQVREAAAAPAPPAGHPEGKPS